MKTKHDPSPPKTPDLKPTKILSAFEISFKVHDLAGKLRIHESVTDEQMMWLFTSAFIRKSGLKCSSRDLLVAALLPGSSLTHCAVVLQAVQLSALQLWGSLSGILLNFYFKWEQNSFQNSLWNLTALPYVFWNFAFCKYLCIVHRKQRYKCKTARVHNFDKRLI